MGTGMTAMQRIDASAAAGGAGAGAGATRTVEVKLGEFAFAELRAEAEREGVTLEELLAHAAMYYLADADSGRISRRFPRTGR